MKLGTKILKRIIMAMLVAMIFPVSSCRDDSQEEPEINGVPTNNIWDSEVSQEEYNWLRNLPMNTMASSSSTISPYFYVYVHVLRTTEGKGYSKEDVSNTILSKLETCYASSGVHFKLLGSKYHDVIDTYLKEYAAYEEGQNRIYSLADNPNAIDVFVVSDCNNKVGHGTMIGHTKHIPSSSCILYNNNYNSYWIAHKIGHCLGLLNTHCCTGADPKGHHIPQKELVDGTNSDYAGDLITDTPADPGEWDPSGRYTGTATDANGQYYYPDPKNIMCTSGLGEYITPKQHERIVSVINAAEFFRKMQVRTIKEKQHLATSGTVSIENIQPEDRVEWTVKEYDGFTAAPSKTFKVTTQSYTYSPTSSHYFVANAKVFLESGDTISLSTQVTTGAPDPSFGHIAWQSTNTNQ